MDEQLQKDLQELLQKHPQLKHRSITFTGESQVPQLVQQPVPLCKMPVKQAEKLAGPSSKIEVRKSPVHGQGVFAREAIEPGELIEECRLLRMALRSAYGLDSVVKDYIWANKNCECPECQTHGNPVYLALGQGSIYNHADKPNTHQKLDFTTEVMTIIARERIEKDQEIFVTYGHKYFMIRGFWENIKKNNALEKMLESKEKRA